MAGYQHRTIRVGDVKTHFLEAGSGPDLLLLHGGEYGASAEITWKYSIESLAQQFHVVAPDVLGWGETDKIYSFSDPAGYRISHMKRFLETIGVEQGLLRRQLGGRRLDLTSIRARSDAISNPQDGHDLRQRQRVQNPIAS